MKSTIGAIFYASLISFLCCQCNSDKKELKIEYYENKQIKTKSEVVNGVKEGVEHVYSLEGKTLAIHHYQKGKLYDVSSFYKKDGRLYLQLSYLNDIKEGPYKIFYNNGNIAESGDFISNHKRGKILHYSESDSGIVKTEFYTINQDSIEYDYYVKKFDSNGRVISSQQILKVLLPNDTLLFGKTTLIKFELDDNVMSFDSTIVLVGNFDEPNFPNRESIRIKLKNKEATFLFTPNKRGYQFFRGQLIMYKNWRDNDSTYFDATYGLFEEPFFVK